MFANITRRQKRRVYLSELTLGTKEMMYKEQRKLDEKLEKIEAQRARAKRHLEAKERILKHEFDIQISAQRRMSTFIGAHTGRFREDDVIANLDWETLINLPDAQGLTTQELSRIFTEITGKSPEIRLKKPQVPDPWQPDYLQQRSKTFHGTTDFSRSQKNQRRPSTTAQYVDGLILQRNLTFIPTNEECKETCRVAWGGLPKIKGINPIFRSNVIDTVQHTAEEVKPKVRVPKALKIRLRALQMSKKLSFKRQTKLTLVEEEQKKSAKEGPQKPTETAYKQVYSSSGDKLCKSNNANTVISDKGSDDKAQVIQVKSLKLLLRPRDNERTEVEVGSSNTNVNPSPNSEIGDTVQNNVISQKSDESLENDKNNANQDTVNFKKEGKQNLWKEIAMNVMLNKRKENEKGLKMSDLVQMLAKVKLAKLTKLGDAHSQYSREAGLDKGAYFRARQKYISSNRHLLARRNSGLQYGPQHRRRASRDDSRNAKQVGYDTWTMQKLHTVMQNSAAYKDGVTQ